MLNLSICFYLHQSLYSLKNNIYSIMTIPPCCQFANGFHRDTRRFEAGKNYAWLCVALRETKLTVKRRILSYLHRFIRSLQISAIASHWFVTIWIDLVPSFGCCAQCCEGNLFSPATSCRQRKFFPTTWQSKRVCTGHPCSSAKRHPARQQFIARSSPIFSRQCSGMFRQSNSVKWCSMLSVREFSSRRQAESWRCSSGPWWTWDASHKIAKGT